MSLHDEVSDHFKAEAHKVKQSAKAKPKWYGQWPEWLPEDESYFGMKEFQQELALIKLQRQRKKKRK